MPPFPGLTQPKIPVNVEEEVPVYETNADVRKFLRAKEEAAAKQVRKQLFQQHFGPKKGGRRTRSRAKRSKAKSRRRK